ncbi:MAG: trypsin-like peptidase domain-containing protein, partial [Planctomycetota bacterium]
MKRGSGSEVQGLRSKVRSRAFAGLALVLFGAAAPGPDIASDRARVREAEKARVDLIQRLEPSVVVVFPLGVGGGGSGVIVSAQGYVLTNYHVILAALAGAHSRDVRVGLPGGTIRQARIVGVDPFADLALVKISDPGSKTAFPAAAIGDSEALRIGDWVLAMGNPFLLATDFRPTVTQGIVSGLHRYLPGTSIGGGSDQSLTYADAIQIDASVNPGNSGGPLFNLQGELVGINGRISTRERGRVNVGIGFAIPTSLIRRFLPDLRAGRLCRHASLGATVREEDGAIVLAETYADGPARKAGLKLGDAILSFDGAPVRSQNDMLNLVVTRPAGWEASVRFRREGKEREAVVTLEAVELEAAMAFDPDAAHLGWERDGILARAAKAAGPATPSFESEGTIETPEGNAPVRVLRSSGRIRVETPAKDKTPARGWVVTPDKAFALDGSALGERGEAMRDDLLLEEALEAGRAPAGGTLEFVGGGRSAGEVCDLLEATIPGGSKRQALVSVETGRLLELRYQTRGGVAVRVARSDFRDV